MRGRVGLFGSGFTSGPFYVVRMKSKPVNAGDEGDECSISGVTTPAASALNFPRGAQSGLSPVPPDVLLTFSTERDLTKNRACDINQSFGVFHPT